MKELHRDVRFYPLGDAAIVIQFREEISLETHNILRSVCNFLEEFSFEGFIEYVPAYTTVTVFYNPLIIDYPTVHADLNEMLMEILEDPEEENFRTVEIPVLYGGNSGPDLEFVADYTKLSKDEVIAVHTQAEYLVHMIGFAPGFPYLGGMDAQIAVPRKEIPRATIAAGSVGIAGKQTGIYPIETPGGWQIIGRTPLNLFDIDRKIPSLLKAGDRIRFRAISETEFEQIKGTENGD